MAYWASNLSKDLTVEKTEDLDGDRTLLTDVEGEPIAVDRAEHGKSICLRFFNFFFSI